MQLQIPDGAVLQIRMGDPLALPAPPAAAISRAPRGRIWLLGLAAVVLAGGGYQAGRWSAAGTGPVPPAQAMSMPPAAPAPSSQSAATPAPWRAFPDAPVASNPEPPDGTAALRRALQTPPTVLPPPGAAPTAVASSPPSGRNAFGLQIQPAP